MEGMNASDVALLARDGQDGLGNSWFGMIIVLFFLVYGMNGGGFGGNRFDNAIGYENLATSNEVQRGFDNQNNMANQREILAAVTNGTAQTVATTNQVFHDTIGYLGDKYNEIQRDLAGIAVGQANALANQNQCCCDVKMLIQENAAQNRLEMAQMENRITTKMDQNEISALRDKVSALELAQATNGVLRYPNSWTWNAGMNPFCACGNGCNGNI